MRQSHWNHNTHHHRLVLNAVPAGADPALDVGTGDGLLAAELLGGTTRGDGVVVDGTRACVLLPN